jgi:hypothetical protein
MTIVCRHTLFQENLSVAQRMAVNGRGTGRFVSVSLRDVLLLPDLGPSELASRGSNGNWVANHLCSGRRNSRSAMQCSGPCADHHVRDDACSDHRNCTCRRRLVDRLDDGGARIGRSAGVSCWNGDACNDRFICAALGKGRHHEVSTALGRAWPPTWRAHSFAAEPKRCCPPSPTFSRRQSGAPVRLLADHVDERTAARERRALPSR